MKRLTDFFLLCSGVNPAILEQCPGEKTKYAGLGASIFFTGLFAFLAASYALYFVFNNIYASVIFGLLWGLMIFNLDRYIVSTMRKRGNFLREFASAVPRIIVAIIISIVIAKPLELKIFEKEIDPELVLMEQKVYGEEEVLVKERFSKTENALRQDIALLDNNLSEKLMRRDTLLKLAQEEADGTGGSRVKNLGPIYKAKKADADEAQKELEEYRIESTPIRNSILDKIESNDSLRNVALRVLKYSRRDGPAARMEALENLKVKSGPIRVASIFIMLLIIALETAPVFVKLISPKGPYDNLLNTDEFAFSTNELENTAKISAEARGRVSSLTQTEGEFLSASLNDQLKTR